MMTKAVIRAADQPAPVNSATLWRKIETVRASDKHAISTHTHGKK